MGRNLFRGLLRRFRARRDPDLDDFHFEFVAEYPGEEMQLEMVAFYEALREHKARKVQDRIHRGPYR